MADDVRQEKVAAGLKKLRNFQQRSRKNRVENHKSNNQTINVLEEDARSSPPLVLSESSIPGSPSCASEDNAEMSSTYSEMSSSKESLRQLRQQVNGLMSETDSYLNGEVVRDTEGLEQRNQELAALLDQKQQQISQLQSQLLRTQEQLSQHQSSLQSQQDAAVQLKSEEVATLQQQLQVHIQTIGILVAEKTELQSALNLSQQTVSSKTVELEDLQMKLKSLRIKLAEKEREFTSISQFNEMSDKNTKELSSELEKEKKEGEKLRKQVDDLRHEVEEMKEKYNTKMSECQNLEQAAQELRNQLQLAQLYSQQLQSPQEVQNQLEQLQNWNVSLQTSLEQAGERHTELIQERDSMARAHQAHLAQCSADLATLREELGQVTQQLSLRSREVENLREQLDAAVPSAPPPTEPSSTLQMEQELCNLRIQLEQALKQNEELRLHITKIDQDNQSLRELAAEQEMTLERWQEQEVDREQLLASIQSDKVAASRATAQNKDLKCQLEELQAAIVAHSNAKLELTEELSHERHVSKELGERLGEQEEEMNQLQEEVQELRKQTLVMSQLEDKVRHYEAQQTSSTEIEVLQKRLEEVQAQNVELRAAIARQAQESIPNEPSRELARKDDLVAALSASVQQLEAERNQLLHTMGEQQTQRSSLRAQLSQLHAQDDPGRGDSMVSQEEYRALKSSMEQLEEKFRETMNKMAELSDEKQHLEHLVTQLQGETETIGDYIQLYQVQRGLMKKREAEKDEYIALLAQDRETLKEELRDLQVLVQKLLKDQSNQESPEQGPAGESPHQVASHIQSLLHHLECQNLLEGPQENFHPCHFCSGRLLHL